MLANLTEYALTEKVFEALHDADCWSDYRAHLSGSDDSNGGEETGSYMLCIWAMGRLRSGDIWVAMVTEEDQDQLVVAADRWLPKLSDLLSLAHRTYPILVLGMPSTFDTSINGEDMRGIIDSNNKFIEHPSAIQHIEFLPHRRTQAASRENRALIICFADPTRSEEHSLNSSHDVISRMPSSA